MSASAPDRMSTVLTVTVVLAVVFAQPEAAWVGLAAHSRMRTDSMAGQRLISLDRADVPFTRNATATATAGRG